MKKKIMKNKALKIGAISILALTLTGCTKTLKDVDNKIVKNEKTGQTLTANILCKPTNEDIIELYNKTAEETKDTLDKQLENNEITKKEYQKKIDSIVDIESLPECSKFNITSGGYQGIWNTIFVKPLAWIIINVGKLLKNYGLAVICITLLIRLILYPITKKTAMQSEKLKQAKPELDKLEKKYKDKQDQQSMMMKSQEMLSIYKKYNINPASGCLFSFIQIPLFFAFYEALYRLPVIFEETLLGFELGTSPINAMQVGDFKYVIFIILVTLVTYFSMKLNSTAAMGSEQEQQMKMMSNMMVVFIAIASFTVSTGIALYWITNNSFTIVQNLLAKRGTKNENIIKKRK